MVRSMLSAVMLVAVSAAAEDYFKPYVLVEKSAASPEEALKAAQAKLEAAGFTVAGQYSPYKGAVVMAVTSPELKAAAAKSEAGGYGAAVRVSATRVGDETQLAYSNPRYFQHAYRMSADLAPVAAKLAGALGKGEEFGPPKGKAGADLEGYHYMVGMPYFTDPVELASFSSQKAALDQVEAGLAKGKGGTVKVYRVDLAGKEESVFGIGLSKDCGADEHVMGLIDQKAVRSTPHLPYELLVSKGKVQMLHGRFRLAVDFPDLTMGTFMKINCAPGQIEDAFKKVVEK